MIGTKGAPLTMATGVPLPKPNNTGLGTTTCALSMASGTTAKRWPTSGLTGMLGSTMPGLIYATKNAPSSRMLVSKSQELGVISEFPIWKSLSRDFYRRLS